MVRKHVTNLQFILNHSVLTDITFLVFYEGFRVLNFLEKKTNYNQKADVVFVQSQTIPNTLLFKKDSFKESFFKQLKLVTCLDSCCYSKSLPFLYTCDSLQDIAFFHVVKVMDIVFTVKEIPRAYFHLKHFQKNNQFLEYFL